MIQNVKVLSNQRLVSDTVEIKMTWDGTEVKPGQFLHIQVPNQFLRRPISISQADEKSCTIVVKDVGKGTHWLAQIEPGESLNVQGPLGNGFKVENKKQVTLVGGGVGIAPLVQLAKRYQEKQVQVDVVLGVNTADQLYYDDFFKDLDACVHLASMDGSIGVKGTVMDAIDQNQVSIDYVQACGPMPMLKAISQHPKDGQVSLEARMACGVGACMGCVVVDKENKSYRVCKDGPVFDLDQEVLG